MSLLKAIRNIDNNSSIDEEEEEFVTEQTDYQTETTNTTEDMLFGLKPKVPTNYATAPNPRTEPT